MAGKDDRPHRKTVLGLFVRVLMLASAGLLVLSYLSVYVNPAKCWWMTLSGLLFAPLLALNLFLLVWGLFRRSKALLIPLVALLPSLFIMGKYYQFSKRDDVETLQAGGVKIVSYNVGRYAAASRALHLDGHDACVDSVAAFLLAQDADIICLQEFHMEDADAVKSYLSKTFSDYYAEYYVYPNPSGCYGNVTLSRFPFGDRGRLDFDKSSNLTIYADCIMGDRKLRIYNCHFQSYNISIPNFIKSLMGDYRKTVRDTELRLRESILKRPEQVEMVMNDIEECPVESIIAGDFNDTPMSYTYHRLSKGHRDTFVEAGKGGGATYYALRPFLRIDYILFPETCKAISHKVIHKRYSDHYPIISEIKI